MRALYLVLLFALCLPLQAGDPQDLDRAVEMFRSPHPAVRVEGSKVADKELRKLLAPLLKAMEDPDPEVSATGCSTVAAWHLQTSTWTGTWICA